MTARHWNLGLPKSLLLASVCSSILADVGVLSDSFSTVHVRMCLWTHSQTVWEGTHAVESWVLLLMGLEMQGLCA